MKKMSSKQIITAAFLAAVIGLSGTPLSAGAEGSASDRNNNSWSRDNNNDQNNRGDNWWNDNRRGVSEWQARRIAQNVFPRKHIVRVELRGDDNRREYQVRFADGSRVDVRVRDGQVTYVNNNSRRNSFNTWR